MTLKQQCEAWKSLALAYEVFIEDAADMDAEGMAAALKSNNRSRANLVAEGLLDPADEPEERKFA